MKQNKPETIREQNNEIGEFRKKKRKKRLIRKVTRFLIICLLLGMFAAGFYLYEKYDLYVLMNSREDQMSSQPSGPPVNSQSFPISLDAAAPVGLSHFGPNNLLLTSDEAIVFGEEGNIAMQSFHGYTNPVVRTGENRYLLYDRGGHSFCIQNQLGTIYSGRSENTILGGACGHKSSFALVTSESRHAGKVTVYGKNGDQLFSWISAEPVVDLAFSQNDRKLAVATVAFENTGILNARVHLIDLGKGEEQASADFPDSLPIAVNVLENGTVHLVTDNFLGILSEDLSSMAKEPYLQPLRKFQFDRKQTVLVISTANEVSSTISLIPQDGEKKELPIRSSVTDISLDEKGVCVLAGGNICTYSNELEMQDIVQTSSDVFRILYNRGTVYTMSAASLDRLKSENMPESGSSQEGESD